MVYAVFSLRGNPEESWQQQIQAGNELKETTWVALEAFLLGLLGDKMNRTLTVAQQYNEAKQRESQSVREFDAYLNALEAQLDPYTEAQRVQLRITRIKPDLRVEIYKQNLVPKNRLEFVENATRLENALKEAKSIQNKSSKQQGAAFEKGKQEEKNRKNDKSSKPSGQNQKASGSDNKPKRDAGSSEGTNKATKIDTCWNCGQQGHRANVCPKPRDEEAFERRRQAAAAVGSLSKSKAD